MIVQFNRPQNFSESGLVCKMLDMMPPPSGRRCCTVMIILPHVTAKINKGLSEVFLFIDKLIPWQSQEIQAPAFTTLLLHLIIFLQVRSWREFEEQVN